MNPLLAALVATGAIDAAEAERLNRLLDTTAARQWAEQQLAAVLGQSLEAQQRRLLQAFERDGARALMQPSLWTREDAALARDVLPTIRVIGEEQALVAAMRAGDLDMWRRVNERVVDWVESYYISNEANALGAIPNLNATARTQIGNLVDAWQRGELEAATRELGLPQLIAAMEDTFGAQRGARIAVTETTRIFAESARCAALENPYVTRLTWLAAADEVVCPVCGPMHGRSIDKAQRTFPGGLFPPAHPNCRCWVAEETAQTTDVAVGSGGTRRWTYA